MLELAQLRQSLLQTLENFQRCGVTRLPRATADSLPPEVLAKIAELRSVNMQPRQDALSSSASSAAPVHNSATTPIVNSPVPAPIASPVSTNSVATIPVATSPASTSPVAESEVTAERTWSLPTLSVEERRAHFDVLSAEVANCRKCSDIVCFRQQTVFGAGPLQPTVCFLGEAPGADEDKSGQPFVGRAGQLLTKIIEAMQLKRDEVYILNALKCRPPQNRTPVPEEIEQCHPFVEAQLEILQPKFIVCLGAVAVRSLLGLTLSVGSLRGRFHQYRQARVIVTYHPSYLLRNESAKKLVWQDMQMLMQELGLKLPGKH